MLPVEVCAHAPGARAIRSPITQTMVLLMWILLKFIFLNNIHICYAGHSKQRATVARRAIERRTFDYGRVSCPGDRGGAARFGRSHPEGQRESSGTYSHEVNSFT